MEAVLQKVDLVQPLAAEYLTAPELWELCSRVVPANSPLIQQVHDSLWVLSECPCPCCERRFNNTPQQRQRGEDRAVLELLPVSGKPGLVQLHLCCEECLTD